MSTPITSPSPPNALPRFLTVLLGLAAGVVSVAGIKAFAGTLGPAFLALVLVITVQPVQARLRQRNVPSRLTVFVLLLLVYAIILGLLAALALSVSRLATLLPAYGPQFTDLLNQSTDRLDELGIGEDQLRSAVDQLSLSNLVGPLQRVLGGVTTVLSDAFFIVALVFFLAVEAAGFSGRLTAAAGQRPQLVAALKDFASNTRRYVAVSTIFGLVVAAVDVVALYWLGVPLPLLWGLLSFITNYIPNVGFVLGLVPPALLALLEGGVGRMVAVIVAYSIINVVFQSVIQPMVVGDAVGLSATVTFLSLVFWAFVFGPLGALLAVPLSLLAKALLVDADPALHWLRPLLVGSSTPGAEGAAASGAAKRQERRRAPDP
ncbi:MAG: AI-2E family transporter [Mycobacterium sp.]